MQEMGKVAFEAAREYIVSQEFLSANSYLPQKFIVSQSSTSANRLNKWYRLLIRTCTFIKNYS